MTLYRCLVVSAEGRSEWRRIEAASERGAATRLAADRLVPIEIRCGAVSLAERLDRPVRLGRAIGTAEQALILGQLTTLVRSGLPVDRSLDLLREQAPRAAVRDLIGQVLARVRAGGGLAGALEERAVFPAYATGVIRAAERAGRLGEALASVAERMAAAAATRRRLVTALTYPAAVLATTVLALLLVLTLVVPQFAPIFAGEEARLPVLTRSVLWLSALVTDGGLMLLAALLSLGGLIALALRSATGAALLRRQRSRIPGTALRDQYLAAQLCGLLATLLGNGVAVTAALPLARGAMGSRSWRAHLGAVERRVREGASLSAAFGRDGPVPATAIRLMEVGERSGRLAETCAQAGAVLSETAQARIERALALVNPVAIVTLGAVVAALVAGVMLGIFSLGDFAG